MTTTPPPIEAKSLRDSFAEHALVGVLAYTTATDINMTPQQLAAYAYEIADAMLVERNTGPK